MSNIQWCRWHITASISSEVGHNEVINREFFNFWTDAADVRGTLADYYARLWSVPETSLAVDLARCEVLEVLV